MQKKENWTNGNSKTQKKRDMTGLRFVSIPNLKSPICRQFESYTYINIQNTALLMDSNLFCMPVKELAH